MSTTGLCSYLYLCIYVYPLKTTKVGLTPCPDSLLRFLFPLPLRGIFCLGPSRSSQQFASLAPCGSLLRLQTLGFSVAFTPTPGLSRFQQGPHFLPLPSLFSLKMLSLITCLCVCLSACPQRPEKGVRQELESQAVMRQGMWLRTDVGSSTKAASTS